ncbi:MAG TPA: hypothetical protein VMJ93_12900 [Verrucomicrobiae bacterium]|nr:hypothetical protein [Verrucomicrobiae bacterium]
MPVVEVAKTGRIPDQLRAQAQERIEKQGSYARSAFDKLSQMLRPPKL